MLIYKQEKLDNLSHLLSGQGKYQYDCSVSVWGGSDFPINEEKIKSIASSYLTGAVEDQDLFYIKAVLVSSTWNKNNTVFLPEEIWKARNTPLHKPSCVEHDQSKIVGHITDSWVVDHDNNIITEDAAVEDLPDLIHLCVGSVLYLALMPPHLNQIVQNLLTSIRAGEQYVSMEVLFNDFDYALQSEDQVTIIQRNQETAFLTKYLTKFGGAGVYDGKMIGLVPRNLIFSGKGFTKKPANPYSIIFNDSIAQNKGKRLIIAASLKENQHENQTFGVLDSQETLKESSMSELNEIKEVITNQLEVSLKAMQEQTRALAEESAGLKRELETKSNLVAELEKANKELSERVEELEKLLAKAEAEKILLNRTATLVGLGLSEDEAREKAAVFASLDEEQFNAVAETLSQVRPQINEQGSAKKYSLPPKQDESESVELFKEIRNLLV